MEKIIMEIKKNLERIEVKIQKIDRRLKKQESTTNHIGVIISQ